MSYIHIVMHCDAISVVLVQKTQRHLFLKHSSSFQICIEFCIKDGKHIYCLYQAHYLYKITNNSFILKPKLVAAILRKKSDYYCQKIFLSLVLQNLTSNIFFTYIFPIHISLNSILYFGASTKDTIISPKIVISQLW